ncbi:hypothetical protein ACMD2_26642 [Ananas comosus]|uniref:Uncharacterized protein n=1 Tax=Ananas comosus TaxID=4615 RepID=A0A199VP46_ANACO|nr:hypothetical protein ACMD2_26642 [Ananas comosus]
MQNFSMIQI